MSDIGNPFRISHHQIIGRREERAVARAALRVRVLVDEEDLVAVAAVAVAVVVEVQLRGLVPESIA